MRTSHFLAGGLIAAGFFVGGSVPPANAAPIVPTGDDEVVEVLPATSTSRTETQRLRKQLAARPGDAKLAHAVAARYLAQAHELGDPRFAGLALAALRAWPDPATTPSDLLLMRATLQQYLHEFDASVASLRQLLSRPTGESHAQAWLTLATVLRVQGQYGDSDVACRELERRKADVYAAACLAENEALRGHTAAARRSFQALLADTALASSARAWLTTSLAELEERDGRVAAADAAYRAVLKLGPDPYAAVAYADFLLAQRRPNEAVKVLEGTTRSDGVVLRLAMAEQQAMERASAGAASRPNAAGARSPSAADMRERIALANERPQARVFHGREQAMFALFVDRSPELAFELAQGNAAHQREPLDLLVLAQAARATGRAEAIEAARRLKSSVGLHDRRIDALL
jgi:hypothetical protein